MSDLFTDHRTQILKLTLGARGGQSGGLGGGEREQWDSLSKSLASQAKEKMFYYSKTETLYPYQVKHRPQALNQ